MNFGIKKPLFYLHEALKNMLKKKFSFVFFLSQMPSHVLILPTSLMFLRIFRVFFLGLSLLKICFCLHQYLNSSKLLLKCPHFLLSWLTTTLCYKFPFSALISFHWPNFTLEISLSSIFFQLPNNVKSWILYENTP